MIDRSASKRPTAASYPASGVSYHPTSTTKTAASNYTLNMGADKCEILVMAEGVSLFLRSMLARSRTHAER